MNEADRRPEPQVPATRWARFLGTGFLPRLAVTLIGVPVLALIATAGGLGFRLLVLLIVLLGLREFFHLAEVKGYAPFRVLGYLGGVGLGAHLVLRGDINLPLALIIVGLMSAELLRRDMSHALSHISVTLFGILYVSWLGSHLVLLRELVVPAFTDGHFGLRGLAFAALITWVNDILAYLVGVAVGSHRLWPRVSPAKSVEGALGGLAGATAIGAVAVATFLPVMPVWAGALTGLGAGVMAQVGDLVESLLKRDAGIKDSATLLPGHGGVLDRFDSLFFVTPLIYYLLRAVVR